jgi:hypothetical protein
LRSKMTCRVPRERFGEVMKVVLFDKEPEGVLSVRFKEFEEAEAFVEAYNGKGYNHQKLERSLAEDRPNRVLSVWLEDPWEKRSRNALSNSAYGHPVCDDKPSMVSGPGPPQSEELVAFGVARLPTGDAVIFIGILSRSGDPDPYDPAVKTRINDLASGKEDKKGRYQWQDTIPADLGVAVRN